MRNAGVSMVGRLAKCPEAKGPNGESVFATKEGNGVSLTRSMWQNLGGVASYGGTGSVRGNDILLAAILYGEMAHQTSGRAWTRILLRLPTQRGQEH